VPRNAETLKTVMPEGIAKNKTESKVVSTCENKGGE